MSDNITVPLKGMQFDVNPASLDSKQAYTYALNARQESEDGNQFNITNEPSNTLAINNFPENYKVIGYYNIVELGKTIYFLTNPETNECEIGFVSNNPLGCVDTLNLINPPDTGLPVYSEDSELSLVSCMTYETIISSKCLNFSIDYPVHDIRHKTTNRTTEIYWTDNYNPPRWMDINNPPLIGGFLDCNLLSIFPDFDTPEIKILEIQDTGSLKVGSYQFLVAYSNSVGAALSQYYSVTNPTPIWDNKYSETLSFDTSKSIKLNISNLDNEFKYINIAVIKTVNFTQTFEIAATLSFTDNNIDYVYTGNDKSANLITREELYFRSPYYKTAKTLETQNKLLMMGNLTTDERINYQSVASAIKPLWETWRVPYNKFEAYNNGANSANIKGYMRDEVYAFDMVVIEKSGRVSDKFPLVGRSATNYDLDIINNLDSLNSEENPCEPNVPKHRWQVYNTGSVIENVGSNDPCYIGPWEYGEFAYWESSYNYPNNPLIWGSLANTPIRHFKFPDNGITHIHDNNPGNDIGYEHSIYPIGVKFDMTNIMQAIQNSTLTQAQKDNIAAIKILRSNRRTNKSIEAKGILYNVGEYKFQDQTFLYPNYPFNDVSEDVFLSNETFDPITGLYTSAAPPYSGQAKSARLKGFNGNDKSRYSFISPDTSFIHPSLSGHLKLETVEFGKANAHIIQVKDNPRYEIGTQNGVKMAVVLALSTILSYRVSTTIGTGLGVTSELDINFSNFLPSFIQAYDLISKLVPFEQYGYQYNAVGNYSNYKPIADNGNKIRQMLSVGYIQPGIESIPNEIYPINNFQRESSVYIKTSSSLPYPWDSVTGVQRDNSRFTIGSYKEETGVTLADGERVYRDIAAYYASIKRNFPDQYGQIHSYMSLDTGSMFKIGLPTTTVFGGDTYINRFAIKRKLPFFISNTVGQKDNTDIDYSRIGNVSYPTYYMSTSPIDPRISSTTLAAFEFAYNQVTGISGIISGILTGGVSNFLVIIIAIFDLLDDILTTLGIKKVNLDRYRDEGFFLRGVMYLFAYGIPYFFVESDFNCDYRQAINGLEGNYFPNVGTDIPDYWLQETRVSIAEDNNYTYNRDLSKQNIEDFYTSLPEDWNPNNNTYLHTTRVIQSEPYNIEEQQNNWLIFKPNTYWDFTYNNGPISVLRAIEQEKVVALFENNMSIYNAFITLETNIKDAVAGSGNMFSTPPQEYSRTAIGYSGSQHHAFTSTPNGHFWVDAKRGCVFNLSSQGLTEISKKGMTNWFKENLPFRITQYFPNYNIDNNFKDVGICLVWDNRFNRLFITKLDYIPLKDVIYEDGKFYVTETVVSVITDTTPDDVKSGLIPTPDPTKCCPEGFVYTSLTDDCINIETSETTSIIDCVKSEPTVKDITVVETIKKEVFLCDPEYFCNASWTIAYTPSTDSWVSFYSFKPNYYVEQQQFFQSGVQNCQQSTLWNHLLTNKSYQTFYNTFYPFEIESVTKTELNVGVLTTVSTKLDVLRYENLYDARYMKDIFFNKAIIYSLNQTSGLLNLHVQRKNDMSDGMFAKYNIDSIDIPVSRLDNVYNFNKISDVTKDANSLKPLFVYDCSNTTKVLNSEALDYYKPNNMFKKQRLKSDYFKIKLINDVSARFKYIYRWINDKTTKLIR